MICASEQSVTAIADIYDEVKAEFERRGCYFLKDDEIKKVGSTVIINGGVNAKVVGQSAFKIAEMAGVKVPEKTKILILPFPNNPTGSVMSKDELEKIVDVIIEKDLFVISDEIYAELTYGEKHTSIASLPGMMERTIVINGFSKAYAMTGWRLGYAAGPEVIIKQMIKLHQFSIMCAASFSQHAAIEALKNGDADVEMMTEAYDQRRRLLIHELRRMGLPTFEARGAFYVFPCIKGTGMTSEEFATRLLKEEKVAVVPGTAFGDSGEGYLRISYAYSIEKIKEALERIERFVKKYQKQDA
jgi:aminotransferase